MNVFGEDAKFHHIGLAVKSIQDTCKDPDILSDPIQKVLISFIDINGASIELLEPLSDDSPISKGLEQGKKLVHLCFEVDDIEKSLKIAKENDFRQISPITPANAFGNRKIVWTYNKFYGLFELLERA